MKDHWLHRLLLVALVIAPQWEEMLPSLSGMGLGFVVYLLALIYVLLFFPENFLKICQHPLVFWMLLFVVLAFLAEQLHPKADVMLLWRISQMFIGSLLVASLCWHRRQVHVVFCSLGVGAGFLAFLWFAAYAKLAILDSHLLSHMQKLSFAENLRYRLSRQSHGLPWGDLNDMAHSMLHGVLLSCYLALNVKKIWQKWLLNFSGFLGLLAIVLSMSRSALWGGLCLLVWLYQEKSSPPKQATHAWPLFRFLLLSGLLLVVLPTGLWQRLDVFQLFSQPKMLQHESRYQLLQASIQAIPEMFFGVGAGHFWHDFGQSHGFYQHHKIHGPHNVFIAVALYWGLPLLLVFLSGLFCIYQDLSTFSKTDPLFYAIAMLLRSAFLYLMVSHCLYQKFLAVFLGLFLSACLQQTSKKASCVSSGSDPQKEFFLRVDKVFNASTPV